MKDTGIVRRIDELGRVVIPKELRSTLRIKEGNPVEIFTTSDGDLILRKYSLVNEMKEIALPFVEELSLYTKCTALICDNDIVVAGAGYESSALGGQTVPRFLEKHLQNRRAMLFSESDIQLVDFLSFKRKVVQAAVAPIVANGDLLGGIILVNFSETERLGENTLTLTRFVSDVIARQLS